MAVIAVIKDLTGYKYNLGTQRLTEIGHNRFHILFADLKSHGGRSVRLLVRGLDEATFIRVLVGHNRIGCREFDLKTFARILRTKVGK